MVLKISLLTQMIMYQQIFAKYFTFSPHFKIYKNNYLTGVHCKTPIWNWWYPRKCQNRLVLLHGVTKEIQQCGLTGNNHSCQPLLEFIYFNKYLILRK